MLERGITAPPPPWHPSYEEAVKLVKGYFADHPSIEREVRKRFQKLQYAIAVQKLNGSGFLMPQILRHFLLEYQTRMVTHGIHSLPLSFNVIEAFLHFNSDYLGYDLRQEKDHLLSAEDYYDWYTNENLPPSPSFLTDVINEGTVYSYDMVSDADGFRVKVDDSEFVIAGISLVRHKQELSCILVTGESPPTPPDKQLRKRATHEPEMYRGKEGLTPAPDLTVNDRYLAAYPGFGQVLILCRLDLQTSTYDVRNISIDAGDRYIVHTDDVEDIGLSGADVEKYARIANEALERYGPLFSILTSTIFVPATFVALNTNVEERSFPTELSAKQHDKHIQAAMKGLDGKHCITERPVTFLRLSEKTSNDQLRIDAPDLQFSSAGYWKTLPPGHIGEDKDGNKVVGRSWITRTESWFSENPSTVLLTRPTQDIDGADPGVVYVMRSPSHACDIYKVGLTRCPPAQRASQLNTTGVPLPHEVIAQWDVGDCKKVEDIAHLRLGRYRVNPKREYFRVALKTIVATINQIVEEL